MLDEGRITQSTANILMQSVDEALDFVSHGPLCDWKGLKANVHFPSYYKFLQSSVVPRKLVTYFIVGRLESACYICAAFLRAHRIARRQLHDFIGKSFNGFGQYVHYVMHCKHIQHLILVESSILDYIHIRT